MAWAEDFAGVGATEASTRLSRSGCSEKRLLGCARAPVQEGTVSLQDQGWIQDELLASLPWGWLLASFSGVLPSVCPVGEREGGSFGHSHTLQSTGVWKDQAN